jgi:hypothetical protein
MKRRVIAPDGRAWVVQLVWWPRPGVFAETGDAGLTGGGVVLLFGLLVDAIHIVLWPLVFAFPRRLSPSVADRGIPVG